MGRKINFVDDKNVFVGFDYQSSCCESFGYYLTKEIPNAKIPMGVPFVDGDDFPGYNFDILFKQDDGDGSVTFRLVHAESGDEMFLTLYNHHNGYYGHGWKFVDASNGFAIGIDQGVI